MSWDVVVMDYGGEPPDDIAEAEPVGPLGSVGEVRARIDQHLPGIDWSEPGWGAYEGDGFTIRFNMGDEDPVPLIMLHIYGGGDPISTMLAFANPNGWSLLDCTTSELLDPENPSPEGWEMFQEFRGKALGTSKGTKPKRQLKRAKRQRKKSPAQRKKAKGKTVKREGKKAKRRPKRK